MHQLGSPMHSEKWAIITAIQNSIFITDSFFKGVIPTLFLQLSNFRKFLKINLEIVFIQLYLYTVNCTAWYKVF